MKLLKIYLAAVTLLIGVFAQAQMADDISLVQQEVQKSKKAPKKGKFCSKLYVNLGAGLAEYNGDLSENFNYLNQSSFAFSAGVTYKIIPHLNARVNLSFLKVFANDLRNSRPDLRARNLNFKSIIWDLAAAIEYDVLNLDKYKFTPYVFVGFGVFYFNPYTRDNIGQKQFLQYLGTEGQGLAAYPDRKMYKRIETNIPFGGGVKWACTKKVTLQLEFNYRNTNTDYIDDVSRFGYPDKALLDARNPRSAQMTYRGAGPYPTNPNLNRGNPKKNDVFYTTQIKVGFKL